MQLKALESSNAKELKAWQAQMEEVTTQEATCNTVVPELDLFRLFCPGMATSLARISGRDVLFSLVGWCS